jgi:hypothetical protein
VNLLSDRSIRRHPDKVVSNYMGRSEHPHVRFKNHNRELGYKVGHNSTASISPHWHMPLVTGPFETRKQAVEFETIWRTKRGAINRILFGLALAYHYNIQVLCDSVTFCTRLYEKHRHLYHQLYN